MPLSDEVIIAEAIRMVNEGVCVTFPVKGRSMLPFIVGGRESLILEKPVDIKVGDVVLAFVDGRRHVVHRVARLKGTDVTLMGDGNLGAVERCELSDIRALATYVVSPTGKRHYLYTPARKLAARLWNVALPIRRYLLKIYLVVESLGKKD